jgi:phosphatidylglycerophosphate synthase
MTLASWVTLLRLLIALTGAFTLRAFEPYSGINLVTSLFIISIVLDKLDGVIARKFDCCTDFGKRFDIAADKIILAVFFLCLMDLKVISRHLLAASFTRDLLTQAFRSYASSKGIILRNYNLSKVQYVIQCVAVASGLSSFISLGTSAAGLLRQVSVLCFVFGLVSGCLVLGRLIVHYRRKLFLAAESVICTKVSESPQSSVR